MDRAVPIFSVGGKTSQLPEGNAAAASGATEAERETNYMKCPNCGSREITVKDSRSLNPHSPDDVAIVSALDVILV
jgi:predicted RNA-binding Zn-ribbon protein involved in translation (DUF1610 family)